MVHFEPLLIAALDFLGCRLGRKAECFESFGFQYLELSLLGADPRLPGVSVAALTLLPQVGRAPVVASFW
jgi:hypothetical protein